MTPYVSLHNHTSFSILDSLCEIKPYKICYYIDFVKIKTEGFMISSPRIPLASCWWMNWQAVSLPIFDLQYTS